MQRMIIFTNISHKLHITLIELLIVLTLLVMGGGFLGVQIRKALQEQRYRNEVNLVVDQLRLAQDLMLIFDGDVHWRVVTNADDTGFDHGLVFDYPMPNQWAEQLQRPLTKLTTIHYISFYPPPLNDDSDGVDVKFLSGGASMSRAILRLSTGKSDTPGVLSRYICLPGTPCPIVSTSEQLTEDDCLSETTGFNIQLTQRTLEELHAA
ncbi:MAG: type II secretion system protein [Parachlamydiaceae bacterium]|nr:type II secretion system protein [Parachlamydiaceae bacterium]